MASPNAPMANKQPPASGGTGTIEPEMTVADRSVVTRADFDAAISGLRDQIAGILTQVRATAAERPCTDRRPEVASYPTGKPIIQGAMPTDYVVWLGPEPPDGGEICFRARGHVRTVADDRPVSMKCYDGKAIQVSRTTVAVRTKEYVDSLFTSVEFKERCPSGHKYAGRLYAPVECLEHAVYLWLSAPNGKGGDGDGRPLFKFFIHPSHVGRYQQLKESRFNQRKMQEAEVDWVASDGVESPPWQ